MTDPKKAGEHSTTCRSHQLHGGFCTCIVGMERRRATPASSPIASLVEMVEKATNEYQNDLQSDLSWDHMASVSRSWAEHRALPLLREAASALILLEKERDDYKDTAEQYRDEYGNDMSRVEAERDAAIGHLEKALDHGHEHSMDCRWVKGGPAHIDAPAWACGCFIATKIAPARTFLESVRGRDVP